MKPYSDKEPLDPLIGLELTFSNSSTVKDIGDKGLKDVHAVKRYYNFLNNFDQYFNKKTDGTFEQGFSVSVNIEFKDTTKDLNLGDVERDLKDLKISFVGQDEYENKKELFWINVTRDPQVIEIQTMPVNISKLNDPYSLPSTVLDAVFDNCGILINEQLTYNQESLAASQEGGGHINVDAATCGLADNPQGILALIQHWENVKPNEFVMRESQTAARLNDDRFSIRQDFEQGNYSSQLFCSLEKALNKKASKTDQLNSASEVYRSYPQVALFPHVISFGPMDKSEKTLRICIHNQAINIEHLFEESEDIRRIEFREFVAQKSREEVIKCWQIIEDVLFKIPSIYNKYYRLTSDNELDDNYGMEIDENYNNYSRKEDSNNEQENDDKILDAMIFDDNEKSEESYPNITISNIIIDSPSSSPKPARETIQVESGNITNDLNTPNSNDQGPSI